MIKKKLFSLLIPAFLSAVHSLYAEVMPIETTEHHLIHKIIANHSCCVSAFDGDKIFIRPENIIPTNQGLFIHLNESEYYPLPLLQFNKNGYFIQGSFTHIIELTATKNEETKGPCPECDINTNKYGVCKNTQCFFYGLKVL